MGIPNTIFYLVLDKVFNSYLFFNCKWDFAARRDHKSNAVQIPHFVNDTVKVNLLADDIVKT
jgi:hypothetical protein